MAREAGRRRGRKTASDNRLAQLEWRAVENRYRPIEVLSADELEAITGVSYRILEEIGMDFLHPEARVLLKAAGADVVEGSERVRLDRGLLKEALAKVRPAFTLRARNPEHDLAMGGRRISFAAVASAPNASDLEGGRRAGNQVDYRNFLRLGQSMNIIHCHGGYPVEPVDLPPNTRHLDCIRDFLTLTDKVYHAGRIDAGEGRLERLAGTEERSSTLRYSSRHGDHRR